MYIEILDGPRTADQYQFESNKPFMDFLHTLYPRSNDEWETEPIGHIKDMYAAYQAGQSYVSDEGGGPILPLEHPRLRSCSEVARDEEAAQIAAQHRDHLSALSTAPEDSLAAAGQIIVLEQNGRAQVRRAKEALDMLTDDQRADLFAEYCKWCGSKNPRCQRMNDE